VHADPAKLRRFLGKGGGYVNVALHTGTRGGAAWVVENLRIAPDPLCRTDLIRLDQLRAEGIAHADANVPMTAHFDLRPGSVGAGRVDRVLATVLVSVSPLPTIEGIWSVVERLRPDPYPVEPALVDAEGNDDEATATPPPSGGPLLLGPPPQAIEPAPDAPSNLAFPLEVTQYDQPNIQSASMQCMPMGMANVIGYLRIRYNHLPLSWPLPHYSSPGIGQQQNVGDVVFWEPVPESSRIAQIDARTRRSGVLDFESGSGSSRCQYLPALFSYIATQGTPAQIAFRHQDGDAVYGEGATCDNNDILQPLGGITSTREGGDVTWDWVFDQLQKGRGVFLSFGRYDVDGVRTGGHAVRVWGARRFNGRDYFYTLDDSDQGLNTLGLQTSQWEVADESSPGTPGVPNGRLEINGGTSQIEFALSAEAKPTLLIP
jgi:hypothetical protein